jgi:hypothetical protein
MCMYDPPLLLGMPDLSAATICALPLAASATRWRELLSSSLGLTIGFLAAHFLILMLYQEFPPSFFYWMREQTTVVPFSIAGVGFTLVLFYAIARSVRGLWRAEYLQATWYLIFALGLLGTALGSFAYLVTDARAFDWPATELLVVNVNSLQPPAAVEITPINCVFPPFGEGMAGYYMLAMLVVFELLVAVGIADALNRMLARGVAK